MASGWKKHANHLQKTIVTSLSMAELVEAYVAFDKLRQRPVLFQTINKSGQ